MSRPDAVRLAAWFVHQVRLLRDENQRREDHQRAPSLHDIWSHLIVDAWFTTTLRERAHRAATRMGLYAAWAEDVAEETMLRLHKQMQADPTLGFDLRRGEARFAAWMGTILYRQALRASMSLRRQAPPTSELMEADGCSATTKQQDDTQRTLPQAISLAKRLNRFPNTKRAIAHRMAKGASLRQIARDLEMSYKRVRRLASEIRETLRNEFAEE